jgi:hypothetical protein
VKTDSGSAEVMAEELPPTVDAGMARLCLGAAIVPVAIGVLVLAGWIFTIESFKRVASDFVAMNPVTAISFIAAGRRCRHCRNQQTR